MHKVLQLSLLLMLLSGCNASYPIFGGVATQNVSVDIRSQTFRVSKQSLYDAALTYLVLAGYQIEEMSRKSGVITTGYRNSSLGEPGDRTRLTALIQTISKEKTRIILTLTVENSDSTGLWSNEYFSKTKAFKLYSQHLQGIAQQLQSRQYLTQG